MNLIPEVKERVDRPFKEKLSETSAWTYTRDNDIPVNPVYSDIVDRCGCMPCTAFKTWEGQLSQTNPKMYAHIKKLKDKQYVMTGVL